jgi:uncharacterized protein YukE
MPQALSTDTAAQKAVAEHIATSATGEKTMVNAILDEVQAMQATFQGETAMATQAKAAHLHEVGMMLSNQLESIAERVGQSTAGYVNIDSDGASSVSSSGATAF